MSAWYDKFIPINPYSRSGQKITAVRKAVIHWTANYGATALNHYNYFKNLSGRYASAHIFVDKNEAICIIPLNEVAYHANDGSYRGVPELKPNANLLSVSVEMCVEKDGSFHPNTIARTEDVFVELCRMYGLNPLTDIVRHYDITHKNCPAPWVSNGQLFIDFKNRVNAKMKGSSPTPSSPSNGITVGSIVTVKTSATNYATGQSIADHVKGSKYKVIQVKDWVASYSTKAYLLDGIMSWVLEQDIVESGVGNGSPTPQPTPNNLYRVRKSWSDIGSQIGAYGDLNNAIETAKANAGYKVYDSNGNQVYPTASQPTPTPTNLYRVRKTWNDAKSQIGAYKNLEGAKELADLHAKEGYKVFDENGKVVYEPNVLKVNQYYRVRLSWEEPKTQIGAFKDLNNAKELADSRADEGYKVFDDNGKVVYTPQKTQPKEETVIHTVVKGDTLWSISQKYSITVDDIKKKNGLKDNTIFVGQKLVIKGTAPEQEEPKKEEPKEQESEQPKDESKEEPKVDEHKGHNNIIGKSVVSAEKMSAFVKSKNPNAQDIDEIAKAFIEVGERYGIRGDIAFCQSIIETGWFKFDDGTAVTPDQHNYCGLGVTSKGIKGHSFPTVKDGVTAQIQHLFAYATKDNLPEGEEIIDPRFKYVSRGVAPHWEDLNMKWAMNDNYGQHIISIYDQLNKFEYSLPTEEPEEEKETNPSDDLPKEDNKDEQDLEKEKQFKFWTRVIDYLIDKLAKLFGIKKK